MLTVLAIIAVVAGLMFPVFFSVRAAAKGSKCLSNMRQVHAASSMYWGDYDDFFMPVNHRPGMSPNPILDRTWVQLVLPYARNFSIFTCPSDWSLREDPETSFDQDLLPGDIYGQYYMASMHVNMGYNYLYLAPIVLKLTGGHPQWVSEPRSASSLADASRTLLFVDSLWDRLPDGTPIDGGSWLVVPPCRYESRGRQPLEDTFAVGGQLVYAPVKGWEVDNVNSGHLYGNAWPWHNGRVNVARVDGSVKALPITKLAEGCDVRDDWRGLIDVPGDYMWDLK